MAGVGIEITSQGFERLQAKLNSLANIDFSDLLDNVGAATVEQTLERFEKEEDPDGRPWKPLHAGTVLRKMGGSRKTYKKRGGMRKAARHKLSVMKILQDSSWQGGLISTIHHQVSGKEVVTGATKEYAAIHQFGGAEAGMPEIQARPYLGFSPDNLAEIEEIIEVFLKDKLK